MVLYILCNWSGTPVYSKLVFCMLFCVWRCIPDVSVERDVLHIHLLLHHLVLQLTFFYKEPDWRMETSFIGHNHLLDLFVHLSFCYFSCCFEIESCSVMSDSLWTPWTIQSMEFSRQNAGVGSLSLLQGIFPTQGSNPGLLHCSFILYLMNHKGSPRILKWVVYPFSSRSSQRRNQSGVSCIAGRFLTSWDTRDTFLLLGLFKIAFL